jgi:hypothetical protein
MTSANKTATVAAQAAAGCDVVFHRNRKPLTSHLEGWSSGYTAAELPGLRFCDLRRSAVRNMERGHRPARGHADQRSPHRERLPPLRHRGR